MIRKKRASFATAICSLVLGASLLIPQQSTYAADSQILSVMDVSVSALNIRSGPGTSYPVVKSVTQGRDLVNKCDNYPNCTPVSANDWQWMNVYYPESTIGYYDNRATGWASWISSTSSTRNLSYTDGAVATADVSVYSNDCPNLSQPFATKKAGTVFGPSGLQLYASKCNPNAWRIMADGVTGQRFVNGWYMNATAAQ